MSAPVIVWFRQDLRLDDNPALCAAVKNGTPVIPVFIWSPQEDGKWSIGSASRYWLHNALNDLDIILKKKGSRLILQHGPSLESLSHLIGQSGADKLYFNNTYEPYAINRDTHIKKILGNQGLEIKNFNGHLLHEPAAIQNNQGGSYRVFTPFCKHYWQLEYERPFRVPLKIMAPERWPESVHLDSFELIPKSKWYKNIACHWDMSCKGAKYSLEKFKKSSINSYNERRDFPAQNGVSWLSPYLHFGQLSARRIWHTIYEQEQRQGRITPGIQAQGYLRQLVWRDFAYHLLVHFPQTTSQPMVEKFNNFPWRNSRKFLEAWQQGMTGYPIIDAGMRELWQTGWMHNRVRMLVASFLTKDLQIHWLEGAKWFWDTLVDADLANNTLGWQWVAGCGADAAPWFRIFNPVTQGERFDADGEYVCRWVPELSGLDKKYIHRPWQAPAKMLSDAAIVLGKTYPRPIVDHAQARKIALENFRIISGKSRT